MHFLLLDNFALTSSIQSIIDDITADYAQRKNRYENCPVLPEDVEKLERGEIEENFPNELENIKLLTSNLLRKISKLEQKKIHFAQSFFIVLY
jgi:hypothetical protein